MIQKPSVFAMREKSMLANHFSLRLSSVLRFCPCSESLVFKYLHLTMYFASWFTAFMTNELYPIFSLKSTVSRFQSLAPGGRHFSQGKALALMRIVRRGLLGFVQNPIIAKIRRW